MLPTIFKFISAFSWLIFIQRFKSRIETMALLMSLIKQNITKSYTSFARLAIPLVFIRLKAQA